MISTAAPRRVAGEAGTGEKSLQRIADAGAAVPVADQTRGGGKCRVSRFETSGALPASAACESEDLDPWACLRLARARRRLSSVRAFIDPETSISSRIFPRPFAAFQARQFHTSPSLAHCVAQGALRSDQWGRAAAQAPMLRRRGRRVGASRASLCSASS